MNKTTTTSWLAGTSLLLLTAGLGACTGSSEGSPPSSSTPGETSTPTPSGTATPTQDAEPKHTRRLDSIAVMGHSGATGTMSDPNDPGRNATENSWATGENPEVRSIYQRLLDTHPAMEGHNYNVAVNGSTVDNLELQLGVLLGKAEVLPDVVLIQTVDNDERCDGTDPQNYRPFGRTLARELRVIAEEIPGVQFFITSPWASVEKWTRWAAHHETKVAANSGTDPCDVFDESGRPSVAGMRSMQRIVYGYLTAIERACGEQPGCFTDGRALETMTPRDRDLSPDLDHLSIAGHAKYARIAWQAFPDEIKERP